MKRSNILCAAIGATLLGGCAIGPDYKRPAVETPIAYKETADWKIAEPRDEMARGKWWKIFGDSELDALIEQVNISNQSLKSAEARYRQATSLTQSARASYLPTVSANASSTRSRSASARSAGDNAVATNHSLTLNAGWELDVWGRIRRTVEANDASAQASAADLEAARLSLQSELATSYFQLRVNDAQKQLFADTIVAFEKSLELTRNRYAVGVAGKVDIVQAETQLLSAQAQSIDLGVQRAQLEHAIAVLIGKAPTGVSVTNVESNAGTKVDWKVAMPVFPLGLPSTLLERRPDIAAAERRAAAANAQIGVAKAAYFPTLSLSGSGGFSSPTLSNWISAPNRAWSLGPSLAETIFDFGKRGALTDQAIASYDQTVATYRQTVLEAFQDVEDNVAALRILEQEAKVQAEAVRAARESVTLTLNQYKAGTVSYLSVVTVQTALLSNERTSVGLLGRRLSATVALVRALGGGWSASDLVAVK
ncbi:MAG: efflux transporter outer membrane subunit [Burkholderiales bacterium]|nr:efflux transporter outer membrane subunit [Burkholderiales bacterium]